MTAEDGYFRAFGDEPKAEILEIKAKAKQRFLYIPEVHITYYFRGFIG